MPVQSLRLLASEIREVLAKALSEREGAEVRPADIIFHVGTKPGRNGRQYLDGMSVLVRYPDLPVAPPTYALPPATCPECCRGVLDIHGECTNPGCD